LNYSKEKILEMSTGAIFHDIGKMEYPESLCRKGCYTPSEMEQIKQHPLLGVEILKHRCKNVSPVSLAIVGQHHERTNGSGYPCGLMESQIDEMAILCAVCDVYDNLVSDKENRSACIPQEALALIYQVAGDEFPRKMVEKFTKLLGIYPVGSFVRLESGEMGIVTKTNRTALLFPQILILFDPVGERLKTPFLRDVSKTNEYNLNHRINCSLDPRLFKIDPIGILVQSLSV
ncbi:MAG: HD domain-containing phosphohydrolase, partial [Fibrobacter sp.]|nr:HD domain-containing phosphohydrolase [Fibrobacter sp.]